MGRRRGLGALLVVLVLVLALVVVQFVRTPPGQTTTVARTLSYTVPGSSALPWPAVGQGALTIEGVTPIRTSGAQASVPIASLAKMMTALLILHDHPLSVGQSGPAIPVSAADVATYTADAAASDSVLAVSAGETLTEVQALEGLMIPSADNIAELLATWDAGNAPAFLAKMNAAAQALGMVHTTYTDPSGLDPTTVSTARDQLIIASAAMSNPVFAGIVAMASVTLPVAGTVQNFDYEVGHDGVVGVKTGSDSAAQGCWAFAANRVIDGTSHAVFGVVLGIPGTSQGLLEPALAAGVALADAAPATVRKVTVVPAGAVVAYVHAPWRAKVAVTASRALTGLAQAGQTIRLTVHLHAPTGQTVQRGDQIGTVSAASVSGTTTIALLAAGSGSGPDLVWRLTRT
jgi:D-alanyl-D-alanine carboxypeptidase (penicillin-binding protein 5/6)